MPPTAGETPEITVVYPTFDTRGSVAERVRTWTSCQTLARDRYRVIVAVDHPSRQAELAPLMAPGDEVLVVGDGNDGAMWNAGAGRAETPWLVFTEGHCLADPHCLEAVASWTAANPNAAAGNFAVGHRDDHPMSILSHRWFDEVHEVWEMPEEWDRLHRAGCVVRAEVFRSLGGHCPRYGQFSVALLAAQLNEAGHTASRVPGASVIHLDDRYMADHHFDTADFVIGECEARAASDPAFFERYFGHDPEHANRLARRRGVAWRMLRAAIAAGAARPGRLAALGPLVGRYLAAATVGAEPRIALDRLLVLLDEVTVDHLPLPFALKKARHLRAHRRLVDLERRCWALKHGRAAAAPDWSRLPAEHISAQTLVGTHGLERHDGGWFRWTEPATLIRIAPAPVERVLAVETGRLRGDPLRSLAAVSVDGRALARGALAADGDGVLRVPLPPARGAAATEVAIVIDPLVAARAGAGDRRRLGLPVLSLAIEPGRAG